MATLRPRAALRLRHARRARSCLGLLQRGSRSRSSRRPTRPRPGGWPRRSAHAAARRPRVLVAVAAHAGATTLLADALRRELPAARARGGRRGPRRAAGGAGGARAASPPAAAGSTPSPPASGPGRGSCSPSWATCSRRSASRRSSCRHAIAGPNFLKADNLLNIANQIAVIAIMAIGMTMVIITGGIDLSVGSLAALSAVVAALLIRDTAGGVEASPAGMVAGCIGGDRRLRRCSAALSGVVITLFGIPPFIVTLAMMLVASGLAYLASAGQSIYQMPESFVWLGRGTGLFGLPHAVVLMLAALRGGPRADDADDAGALSLRRGRQPRGRAALGRAGAARARSSPTSPAALLAGLGGVIIASQLKSGSPTYGAMYELYVIAAVVVGGTALCRRRGADPGHAHRGLHHRRDPKRHEPRRRSRATRRRSCSAS